ncbi:hypothetical protein QOZ80_5BG0452630 [Eleusine coracana subsp. coracana]|nr:hypothetical protein QOZ80_5BG0452630 [Eleusine coracana subsp. coracana]
MASAKRPRPETETMRVEDVDALDCGVCYHPLKPPIFQCKEGHALCSSCRDKLAPTGKCHVRGGYRRCRAMERLVETVLVACPNADHGCNARLIYYDLPGHCKVCPHAPCHCPGESCSFVGPTKQLVDHITGSHGWPCTKRIITRVCLQLKDGFNFLTVDHMVDNDGTTVRNLSNGLPSTDECFKFVVPNSALGDEEKEDTHVKVTFTFC